jgi:hypothetical protein
LGFRPKGPPRPAVSPQTCHLSGFQIRFIVICENTREIGRSVRIAQCDIGLLVTENWKETDIAAEDAFQGFGSSLVAGLF